MYINPIVNINFSSNRKQHNFVKKLSSSNETLNENMQINISNSIDALAKDGSTENIKFLLNTAKNLNYGIRNNSEFKKNIFASSPLANKEIMNKNWEIELRNATGAALLKNNTLEKQELEKQFVKVFNHKVKLSKPQKEIIDLRAKILNSKTIKTISDEKIKNSIKENLDYFIFSSEVSLNEKRDCLTQIAHFVSSKYKINTQLVNKKPNILREILNDIIIKNPNEACLTIKEVDQQRHGMCAAIAACRKLAAYQDKTNYLSNIFSELSASPYMQIFDITHLGSGKKNAVKKAYIDFNEAEKLGYRTIDASALQWMQNSARTGDGVTTNENFVAFDTKNYELFKDSFWLANFPKELANIHEILKYTIKAREISEDINKAIVKKQVSSENISAKKAILIDNLHRNNELLLNLFVKMGVDNKNAIKIRNEILGLKTINSSEPEICKKEKIKDYFQEKGYFSDKLIFENLDKIYALYKANKDISANVQKINNFSSLGMKNSLNKDLFLFAVAFRRTIENVLDNPDYAKDLLEKVDLPNRSQLLEEHLNFIIDAMPNVDDNEVLNYYSSAFKCSADKNQIINRLKEFKKDFSPMIWDKYDDICRLFNIDGRKGLLIHILNAYKNQVEINNKENMVMLSQILNVKPYKADLNKKLNSLINMLENDPSQENMEKVFKYFQITDRISFLNSLIKTIIYVAENPNEINSNKPIRFVANSILGNVSDIEAFGANLSLAAQEISELEQFFSSIEDIFNVPEEKEYIIDLFERKGMILSEDDLQELNKKFMHIIEVQNAQKDNEGKSKKIPKEVYVFNKRQQELINKIQKNFNFAKRYTDRVYQKINKDYQDDLDDIYNELGKNSGNYWVSEEGGSGMAPSELIKIVEQITGKPYHLESDLKRAVEQMLDGKGSGEIMTHVRDYGYSGHAQFIPAVTIEKTPKSSIAQPKTVVWHDNSWGKIERENLWTDENGFERTDYSSNVGGIDGYIVRDNNMNGKILEKLIYTHGINHANLSDDPRIAKLYKGIGEKYSIFNNIVMPGEAANAKETTQEIVNQIFDGNVDIQRLNTVLSKIAAGEKINIKNVEKIDNIVSGKVDDLFLRFEKIKDFEEFSKLPENDELKIILDKVAIISNKYGKLNVFALDDCENSEQINKFKKKLLSKFKKFTQAYFMKNSQLIDYTAITLAHDFRDYIFDFSQRYSAKLNNLENDFLDMQFLKKVVIETPESLKNILISHLNEQVDKNVFNQKYATKIKRDTIQKIEQLVDRTFDANNILNDNDLTPILTLLDKKLNPKNDDELIKFIHQLRNAPKTELQKLLKDTTLDDFGVKFYSTEHYFKSMKAQNLKVLDAFNSRAFAHYQKSIIPPYSKVNLSLGTKFEPPVYASSTAIENFYRTLLATLSYKEIKNNIKKQKEEALREYSARAAFPDIDNIDKDNLEEVNEKNIELIRQYVISIKTLKSLKTIFKNVSDLNDLLQVNPIFKQDYEEKIKPLLLAIITNPAIDKFGVDLPNIINRVLSFESVNYTELSGEFENLKSITNELLKSYDEENIDNTIKSNLNNLNMSIDEISRKFVLPRKNQYKIRGLLQDFVKEFMKHPEGQKHYLMENNILKFMNENSITQKPIELLNETILLAMEDAENKNNKNADVIERHKTLLSKFIDAANQTELEFKIRNAVQTGKIYNFKNYIKDIEISSANEILKVDSKRGMQEVFNALCNEANNFNLDTVNLLCKHTGLGEEMYLALKDLIPFTKYQKHLFAFENKINKTYSDVVKIDKIFTGINVANFEQYLDVIEHFNNKLNYTFKEDIKNKTLAVYKAHFANYAQMFANLVQQIKENDELNYMRNKNKIFLKMLDVNHKKAINAVVENLNASGAKFNDTLDALDHDIDILKNLNLNRFSPAYKDKKQIEDTLDKLSAKGARVARLTQNKLDAIYSEDLQGNIKLDFNE